MGLKVKLGAPKNFGLFGLTGFAHKEEGGWGAPLDPPLLSFHALFLVSPGSCFSQSLQIDEVVPQHGSYELYDMKEDSEKLEKNEFGVPAPETVGEKGEDDADFRSKEVER